MALLNPEFASGSAVRLQVVGDQPIGNEVIFLQQFAHQFQRGLRVSPRLNQDIQHFALSIDGAPQIHHAAVDFQIDFVKMPYCVRLRAALAQVRGDRRPELVYPAPNCFVR